MARDDGCLSRAEIVYPETIECPFLRVTYSDYRVIFGKGGSQFKK